MAPFYFPKTCTALSKTITSIQTLKPFGFFAQKTFIFHMNLLSETFLPSFNNLHVSVKINPSAYPNWFRSVQNHHSFWPFDQNKNNARFHYQVKQSQILQTTSSTTNSSQRQHNHRNMSSQSNQQQETSRKRLMRLLSEGKIETNQQRMERLQEQGYHSDEVVSFSVRITKNLCYMDTQQYNGPDLW